MLRRRSSSTIFVPRKPTGEERSEASCSWIPEASNDARWELTPAAWPRDARISRARILASVGLRSEIICPTFPFGLDRYRLVVPLKRGGRHEQTESELRILNEFVAHVNVAGLNFPHETLRLRFLQDRISSPRQAITPLKIRNRISTFGSVLFLTEYCNVSKSPILIVFQQSCPPNCMTKLRLWRRDGRASQTSP